MKLAILSVNGDTLLEYKEEKVKELLMELLKDNDFDTAWDIITNKLKQKTGKL